MKPSRTKRQAGKASTQRHQLLIAERGASFVRPLAELEGRGRRVTLIVQDIDEEAASFRARVEGALKALDRAPERTVFVAGEPIGPRLVELVRTIVSSLPSGAPVTLAAAVPNAHATRALVALAMTVCEMAHDVEISVEGQPREEAEPHHSWRRKIDRVLHTLLQPPASLRHAG